MSTTAPEVDPLDLSNTGWLELRIAAEQFHDAQIQRIAASNRLTKANIDHELCAPFIEALETAEAVAGKQLLGTYRRVVPKPIRDWVKNTHGLGEPSMARLLGHLGHPIHALPHHWEGTGAKRELVADVPFDRTIGQLWQFCGHGAPGRRARGMSVEEAAALGNPTLKMLVHIITECVIKQSASPYKASYDKLRQDYEGKTHSSECHRCGPSGKPAQEGSAWSKGHQHAAAMRVVGKEILRDLWLVAALD